MCVHACLLPCLHFLPRDQKRWMLQCHKKIHIESSLARESLYRLLGNLSRDSGMCSGNISKRLEIKFKHPLLPSRLSTWLLPRKNLCVHGHLIFVTFPFLCSPHGAEMFHIIVRLLCHSVSISKFFPFFRKREHQCRGCFTLVQGYPLPSELSCWKLIFLSPPL